MIALLLTALLAGVAVPPPVQSGQRLYATHCASCHGAQRWGTPDGPSLRGVGMAVLDFYLRSGRMPAAVPWIQVGDRPESSGQALPLDQVRAIEAYLEPTVGPPAIPWVVAGGNLDRGRALFALDCQHCHAAQGEGGSIGGFAWAPSLHHASIDVVADAIRGGPGEMPRFGEQQLMQSDLNDVASYVVHLQVDAQPAVVPPFRSSGPIPEGAAGYLAIIVLVAFVFTFWRVETRPRTREESVRRDEGERST